MCEIMEKYIAEAVAETEKRVKAETEAYNAKKLVSHMLIKGLTAEQIADFSGYDLKLVKEIQSQIQA